MTLRLDQALRDRLYERLQRFEAINLALEGRRHAAIAFTLLDYSQPAGIGNIPHIGAGTGEAAFILTTRTAKLSSHGGQRAYPGGCVDPGENSQQAALRELEEEVGLQLGADSILGRLDDYPTRSGFVITPYVVWAGEGAQLIANPDEVEQIHRIPLRELLRDDAPILTDTDAGEYPVLKMPLGDEWFAAPSAAIAYQFREVALLGKSTRVAHFDEPSFAWK